MKEIIELNLPDGSSTKITLFQAPENKQAPLFLLFPAMGVEAAYYEPFAMYLAQQGFLVITADIRGLGQSSVRPGRHCDFGYEEMITLDFLTVFEEAEKRFPKNKKYVLGHSLGGQLACLFLSRYKFPVTGLLLLASCSVHPSGWESLAQGRWRVLYGIYCFPFLVYLFGYFPGDWVGFGGRAGKQQLLDWCHQGRSGKYELGHSDFNYEQALQKLKLPVLTVNIENDQMAPPLATRNLVKKLHPDTPVTAKILTPVMADYPKLNHFNWARKPAGMVQLIQDWMREL